MFESFIRICYKKVILSKLSLLPSPDPNLGAEPMVRIYPDTDPNPNQT
jgi:hypothetical protein